MNRKKIISSFWNLSSHRWRKMSFEPKSHHWTRPRCLPSSLFPQPFRSRDLFPTMRIIPLFIYFPPNQLSLRVNLTLRRFGQHCRVFDSGALRFRPNRRGAWSFFGDGFCIGLEFEFRQLCSTGEKLSLLFFLGGKGGVPCWFGWTSRNFHFISESTCSNLWSGSNLNSDFSS